jgi:hypothetical protein
MLKNSLHWLVHAKTIHRLVHAKLGLKERNKIIVDVNLETLN